MHAGAFGAERPLHTKVPCFMLCNCLQPVLRGGGGCHSLIASLHGFAGISCLDWAMLATVPSTLCDWLQQAGCSTSILNWPTRRVHVGQCNNIRNIISQRPGGRLLSVSYCPQQEPSCTLLHAGHQLGALCH